MPWKPIKTAPRGGTLFLAWCEDEENDDEQRWGVCYFSIDDTLCYDSGSIVEDGFEPTHWMPLPERPPR